MSGEHAENTLLIIQEDAPTSVEPRGAARDVEAESNCAWGLRTALMLKDARLCREQAERAGVVGDKAAVPLLCDLLQPPRGAAAWLRGGEWRRTRLAALRALEQIGSPSALPALARVLLDPAPRVQQTAANTILRYGPEACEALHAVLHQSGNWPFSGMKRLVTTLGQLRTPRTSAALVPILLGGQPTSPLRWDRPLTFSAYLALGAALVTTILALSVTSNPAIAFGVLLFMALLGGICWLLLALFCLIPCRALRESYERNMIAMLAVEGLQVGGDKAYLPAVVEGAFGYNRMSPHPARRALQYLLPLVNAEDTERFSLGMRMQLMSALGAGHGPGLDFAILGAMEWLGTGQAVDKVARLAKRGATPALREEAARILPILQARQRQEQAPIMLLRASTGAAPIEHLLRPGLHEIATPTEQLLRPGNLE